MRAGPVEQVLDEVEEAGVRPLQVLEDERDGRGLRHPLEEEAPSGEEVLFVARARLAEPEQMREARLETAPLVRRAHDRGERLAQLGERDLGRVVLADPRAHAHHLCERPVGDAVAVREAAAAMPVHVVREPVDVLLELPREPRLADAGDAEDRDEPRAALFRGGVEEILDELELALAADERRLEPGRAALAAPRRDHAQRPEDVRRLGLALELPEAAVLVADCRLRHPPRRLADEHRSRLGRALDARGRVDEIAGDHALAARADGDSGLAGVHARAQAQLGDAELVGERRRRGDEIERRADRPLGVVLVRDGSPPDGHHRVADELLDDAAVPLDEAATRLEVARQQLADLLGIA
jgi:hypothetical protein